MRHFLVMTAFAVLAAVVFGIVAKESQKEQVVYGLKVFVEFIVIGIALGWILYLLPF
jgi:hypothetical protein